MLISCLFNFKLKAYRGVSSAMALMYVVYCLALYAVPVLFLLLVLLVWHIQRMRKRYEHIPGPPVDSFIRGNMPWLTRQIEEGKIFSDAVHDLIENYGPTVKIFFYWKPMVFTIDQAGIKELLVDGNYEKPKDMYTRLGYPFSARFMGRGLVTETDTGVWARRRAMLQQGFSSKMLQRYTGGIGDGVDSLLRVVADLSDGAVHDLSHLIHKTTFDIIGNVGFSMDCEAVMGNSTFSEDVAYMMGAFGAQRKVIYWAICPRLYGTAYKTHKACQRIRQHGRKVLKERRERMEAGDEVPEDLISFILRCREVDPDYDVDAALDDITTFFAAGSETTANTVCFALVMLMKHPDIYRRVREEADEQLPLGQPVTYEKVNNLKYTGLVFKETLRMYPIIDGTSRVPTKDIVISGMTIPKGTIVWSHSKEATSREELCPQADKFLPERFDDEHTHLRPSVYSYFPFAIGPRNCIGQVFAQVEGKVLLARLAQTFDLTLDPEYGEVKVTQDQSTLRPARGVACFVKARKD